MFLIRDVSVFLGVVIVILFATFAYGADLDGFYAADQNSCGAGTGTLYICSVGNCRTQDYIGSVPKYPRPYDTKYSIAQNNAVDAWGNPLSTGDYSLTYAHGGGNMLAIVRLLANSLSTRYLAHEGSGSIDRVFVQGGVSKNPSIPNRPLIQCQSYSSGVRQDLAMTAKAETPSHIAKIEAPPDSVSFVPPHATTFYYGSRLGMVVTAVSARGIGGDNARIDILHTPDNAALFCRDYDGHVTTSCMQGELDQRFASHVGANCASGKFTDAQGRSLTFLGRSIAGPDGPNYRIASDNGVILAGDSASGYDVDLDTYILLCPNFAVPTDGVAAPVLIAADAYKGEFDRLLGWRASKVGRLDATGAKMRELPIFQYATANRPALVAQLWSDLQSATLNTSAEFGFAHGGRSSLTIDFVRRDILFCTSSGGPGQVVSSRFGTLIEDGLDGFGATCPVSMDKAVGEYRSFASAPPVLIPGRDGLDANGTFSVDLETIRETPDVLGVGKVVYGGSCRPSQSLPYFYIFGTRWVRHGTLRSEYLDCYISSSTYSSDEQSLRLSEYCGGGEEFQGGPDSISIQQRDGRLLPNGDIDGSLAIGTDVNQSSLASQCPRTFDSSLLEQASDAPTPNEGDKAPSLPFISCPSDGQLGYQDGPLADAVHPPLATAATTGLAYYATANLAVLAPIGWHCVGLDGSNGATILVTPTLRSSTSLLHPQDGIRGPVVQLSQTLGDTSGRFSAAKIAARLFPTARQFVERVMSEGVLPRSSFHFGPARADVLNYRSPTWVEYTTPANSDGVGTEATRLAKDGNPIAGDARIVGDPASPEEITILAVRLPPDLWGLARPIVGAD